MSSLRIVGHIGPLLGIEGAPRYLYFCFAQLSQEEENDSSTEVTWGESNSAPMRKSDVMIYLPPRRSTADKHLLETELASTEPGRKTARIEGEVLGKRVIALVMS